MRQLFSNSLRRLVKTESRYARGDRHATILSIATIKGGVGKTTTSVNVACGLAARHGLRTLLVDLDAQGHCATSLRAKLAEHPAPTCSLSEVIAGEDRRQLLDAIVPTEIEGLDLAIADSALAQAEGRIAHKIGKEMLLRDALEITRSHYDVILIDCPPNNGNLTLNALVASDAVCIPTDLSPLAVQGADDLIGTILTIGERLGHELPILGVVLTRVDGRNVSINEAIRDQIHEAWGDRVMPTEIGVNTQLAQAQAAGLPIFEFAPSSRGAEHYGALTDEIALRLRALHAEV